MDQDLSRSSELAPWLNSDFISEFSDLLNDESITEPFSIKQPATLAAGDLIDQGSPSSEGLTNDWMNLSCFASIHEDESKKQAAQTFPGFPTAGAMSNIPPMSITTAMAAPVYPSHTRCLEDDNLAPNSWDSSLSTYTLADSLAEPAELTGLKSEDSFADLHRHDEFRDDFDAKKDEPASKKSKANVKTETSASNKASLADRNRERQQRFRQRQKAKIETLENQVCRLTSQNKSLSTEMSDLTNKVVNLNGQLQEKERLVSMMTTQMSELQCSPASSSRLQSEAPQLTMSYTSPPVVLTKEQLARMNAMQLSSLWKEYICMLATMLKGISAATDHWTVERERLDSVSCELIQLMMHLWDNSPVFSSMKANGYVDESHRRDESEDENWRRIAQSITLSPEQVTNLANLRIAMQCKLQDIWNTRRLAQANLTSCYDDSALTSKDLAMQHLKIKDISDTLSKSMKDESLLARDFDFALYMKVLTSDQRAICLVQAFPRFPDSRALANWIAARHGDQEAHSLMTNYASSSATSYHSNC